MILLWKKVRIHFSDWPWGHGHRATGLGSQGAEPSAAGTYLVSSSSPRWLALPPNNPATCRSLHFLIQQQAWPFLPGLPGHLSRGKQ